MKRFPAKVLLFGEYGLLFGAKALALPFHLYGGALEFKEEALVEGSKENRSLVEIEQLVSYFSHQRLNEKMIFPLDIEAIQHDISRGLYFDSDIPFRYGVGSSGALCAAIYDRYSSYHQDAKARIHKVDLLKALKEDFMLLESYFHGTSSGFDPLVSFLDRSILLEGQNISLPKFKTDFIKESIYLIDTDVVSPTGPLVGVFVEKMKGTIYNQEFKNEFIPLNNQLTDAFIAEDATQLFQVLPRFVELQNKLFPEMFPGSFKPQIDQLKSKGIYIKLLGSGGGGFLLAFVPADETIGESALKLFP